MTFVLATGRPAPALGCLHLQPLLLAIIAGVLLAGRLLLRLCRRRGSYAIVLSAPLSSYKRS